MKIEVGKNYLARDGKTVFRIVDNDDHEDYPFNGVFIDEDGGGYEESFTPNGTVLVDREDKYDLLEEVEVDDVEETLPMTLKVGCLYETNYNQVVTITSVSKSVAVGVIHFDDGLAEFNWKTDTGELITPYKHGIGNIVARLGHTERFDSEPVESEPVPAASTSNIDTFKAATVKVMEEMPSTFEVVINDSFIEMRDSDSGKYYDITDLSGSDIQSLIESIQTIRRLTQ